MIEIGFLSSIYRSLGDDSNATNAFHEKVMESVIEAGLAIVSRREDLMSLLLSTCR